MIRNYWRPVIAVVGLSMVMMSAPGCLITGESTTTTRGTNVAPSTFAQIKVGSTTIGWVHATLGDPSSKTTDGDDEVWKYTYTEHTNTSGAVFLVFGGSTSTEKVNTVFIEFKNDVVINKWRG
jgi:outer membrane protein assembly factor BamE (lipoprotein component of BamABCDE complex)